MPDTAVNHQLPPRSSSSTRWPRKWATLGGCRSTSTTMPMNDAELIDHPLQNNGHHRHSTSLFRKSSTVSRTNDSTTGPNENNSSATLKKSRSLMNVLRSKLNSPTVLRRFRSKSRENSKQAVNEIAHPPPADELRRKKSLSLPKSSPSTDDLPIEQTNARKSRKRDPSPIRRLANRIAHLTRSSAPTADDTDPQPASSTVRLFSFPRLHSFSR